MKNSKYTLIEFIAATECKDFDTLEPMYVEWAKKVISSFGNEDDTEGYKHHGDCQSLPCPCSLCAMEYYLKNYRQFVFNEEEYRKENLL